MILYIEPIDTLFFRDSRPFEAGIDTFAESTLPSPLALYGAIGNCILKKNKTDVQDFLGGKVEDPILGRYCEHLQNTKLRIKGVFLCREDEEDEIYLPSPANLFLTNSQGNWVAQPSLNTEFKWDIESLDLKPLVLPEEKCKPTPGYVSLEEMRKRFLRGERLDLIDVIKSDRLLLHEQRVGHRIARDTSVVEEGFLYSAAHIRFREELNGKCYGKLRILVAVQNLDNLSLDDIVYLGGERKKAKLSSEDRDLDLWDEHILSEIKSGRFFLYLLTPAIFNEGWCKKSWPDEFDGAKLVGAAVNKPVYLSGWKRSTASGGIPRPIKKAVPEGSVYFFETEGWDDERFERLYGAYNFNKSLSDEYPCAGFGTSLIGSWKEDKNDS